MKKIISIIILSLLVISIISIVFYPIIKETIEHGFLGFISSVLAFFITIAVACSIFKLMEWSLKNI